MIGRRMPAPEKKTGMVRIMQSDSTIKMEVGRGDRSLASVTGAGTSRLACF